MVLSSISAPRFLDICCVGLGKSIIGGLRSGIFIRDKWKSKLETQVNNECNIEVLVSSDVKV